MRRISPTKAAAAVGTVTGLWHLIWVALVGLGYAKPVLDFVLQLHFLKISFALEPYAVSTAASLVLLTFTLGAIIGLVFALVWNWLTFESNPVRARDTRYPSPSNQVS